MSLSNLSGTVFPEFQSPDLLKKFWHAIKRVAQEHGTNNEPALTEQELIGMIHAWEPQHDAHYLPLCSMDSSIKTQFQFGFYCNTLVSVSTVWIYTHHLSGCEKWRLYTFKETFSLLGLRFISKIAHRHNGWTKNSLVCQSHCHLSLLKTSNLQRQQSWHDICGSQTKPHMAYAMGIPLGDYCESENTTLVVHPMIEFRTQNGVLTRI